MNLKRSEILILFVCVAAVSCLSSDKIKNLLTDEEKIRSAAQEVLRSHSSSEIVEKLLNELKKLDQSGNGTGCQCVEYNCGCCVHMNIHQLHINDDACVNTSYLPKDYGISVTMNIGKYVIINMTVSARNPPPICVAIPHFHEYGSMCIDFYNLDITKEAFSGCIRLEAHLVHVIVKKIDLGCFRIPLRTMEDYRGAMDFVQSLTNKRKEIIDMV